MRASLTLLVLALALAVACSPPGGAPTPAPSAASADPARPLPSPIPDVVARVNGQPIRIHQILPMAKTMFDKLPAGEQERRRPEIVRAALRDYVDRELLLQEAIARGVEADFRRVQWAYDQMRREHANEDDWGRFLAGQGLDPRALRAELRAQHTVAALLEQEIRAWPVPEEEARAAHESNPRNFGEPGAATVPSFESVRGEVEEAIRFRKRDEIGAALLERLRAKARIEILL